MDKEKLNQQLLKAAEKGDLEGVKDALKKGADIEARSNDGWTALVHATGEDHKDIFEFLLEKSGGLEGVRRQMQEEVKQEKDIVNKLELRIQSAENYKFIVSYLSKETSVGDVKTIKLPPKKEKGRFRMGRIRNG